MKNDKIKISKKLEPNKSESHGKFGPSRCLGVKSKGNSELF